MKCISYFLLSCLLLTAINVSGQVNQASVISADFKESTIQQFTREIESKTAYRFYYDITQFDSLRITLSANAEHVESVLKRAFINTDYHYTLDHQNHIFLTRGREIIAALPYGIFAGENDPVKISQTEQVTVTDLSNTVEQESLTATLGNRLFEIGANGSQLRTGNANLAGYLRDSRTGVPVIGAAVFIENPRIGTFTDQFGYYSLVLPRGPHVLIIKAIGLKDTKRQIMLYSDGKLDIETQSEVLSLKEVIISSESSANVRNVQLGVEKLYVKTIKQVPVVFGETDILRVMLTLPGVKSVGEASNGFNVRGGAVDQNLILFDDLTIYNPSHFFGFFSAFNPDVVKDVELYKSSIPAKFGGRLSSVLDVNSRDGNTKKIMGTAGIGLLTGRMNIEGPLIKDKTSFILGGRTTYSNWLLKLLPESSGYKNSKASFYDVNLRLNHQINEKNNLYLTGYLSDDNSDLNSDTLYGYSNKNVSLKWKHLFNNKFTGVFVSGYSRYQYNNYTDKNPVNAYKLAFDINQINLKADFNYYLSSKHTLDFGLSSIRYLLHPGSFQPKGDRSLITPDVVEAEQAL